LLKFSFADPCFARQIRGNRTMLTTLRIKNFALVEDLTVELQPGYNVITGETGAGKSILIGALSLMLGERADRTLIRSGSDSCCVEAVFDVSRLSASIASLLEQNGLEPCEGQHLVVKRTVTGSGTNRQFMNGSPTTLNVLESVGELLVDIHGPHEHQSLLHPARQLEILDAFGAVEPARGEFGQLLVRRAELERERTALVVDETAYLQQLDLLRFQCHEISSADLKPNEEEQIQELYRRSSNAAKLIQLAQASGELLAESEDSLLTRAGMLGRTLQELQRIDPTAVPLVALQQQAVAALQELQTDLSHYTDRLELDPRQLQSLEERLTLIHSLKRKYGQTLAAVISFGDEARHRLQVLEQRDAELARINGELKRIDAEILRASQELSARRAKLIPKLSKAVSQQLGDLGFTQSRFEIRLATADYLAGTSSHEISRSGFDNIEFQFAPNPGEPLKPLRAIASSGELARVMLALKTVLAAEDRIPVLVFDEVDANVGGETARTVGEKMQQIAKKRQVICITHLAQVAAPAATHYVATKQLKSGRTVSQLTVIEGPQRITELARMLGGQTQATRRHAEELLKS
jgi:DNA repair protein RecN (Recombination protein N)